MSTPQKMLSNLIDFNLLAYNRVYIWRCQTQKISATVKNSGKKFAKIIPCGPTLQLHHADYI